MAKKLNYNYAFVIQEDEDFICIIKLFNENVFGEEVLGKKDRENGEQLIL